MAPHDPAASAAAGRRPVPLFGWFMLGIFTLVGVVGTVAVAIDWLQKLDTRFWQPAVCTIVESHAAERPEIGDHAFVVRYSYRARGEERFGDTYRHGYSGSDDEAEARVLASRYPVGSETDCWIDPDDPRRSALLRGDLWQGLWILVPLVFVAVGVGALWLLRRPDAWHSKAPGGSGGSPGAGFLAAFFGLFLLVGLGFLLPFFVWPLVQVADARSWKETPCEILSSRVRTHSGDDGDTYSVEVLYRYEVGGREYLSDRYRFLSGSSSGYRGKAEAVERLAPGTRTVCYVASDDPSRAVLDRGLSPDFLFGLIPLVFVVVGAGGLGAAVWAARRARKAAARPAWAQPVPRQTSSPPAGVLELEPVTGPVGELAVATVVALVWNGIVAVFVWQLVETWRAGSVDWFLALVLSPFVLIGALLLSSVPYCALALLNPRPRLRLSRATLRAGESAQVDWSFRGSARRIEKLTLRLRGYRRPSAGAGSRSSTAEPFTTVEIVERQRGFGLEFGAASVTLPPDAPPSGNGGDGRVVWKLELEGDIPFWPDVREEFEIEVRAAED